MRADSQSDQDAIRHVLEAAFRAFNDGRRAAFLALWSDDFETMVNTTAPFIWTGPGAVERWYDDTAAAMRENKVEKSRISLSDILACSIVGARAHVLAKVHMTFEVAGTPMKQDGWQTVVFKKEAESWRHLSFSYAGTPPTPADSA